MKLLRSTLVFTLAAALVSGALIGSGAYNFAADDAHWPFVYRLIELARERSIETRAAAIEVPDLADTALIRSGAGNYEAMCVTCHLSPGAAETELSMGLYPRPPRWDALGTVDPREAFWVLKHGIKASGMPAWGKSMEDRYLWGMVAFMRQFPRMTDTEYARQVAASAGHDHGGGETDVGAGDPHAPEESEEPRSSFEPIDDPMSDRDADHHTSPPEHGDDHHH